MSWFFTSFEARVVANISKELTNFDIDYIIIM